jgi:hypothetical protein
MAAAHTDDLEGQHSTRSAADRSGPDRILPAHSAATEPFEALLFYHGPTYKAETKAVQRMLNSIKLTK